MSNNLSKICLLGGISSAEINQFINHRFEVDFSKTIPSDINWKFRDYLRQLVSPDQSERFINAQIAKDTLRGLNKPKSNSFLLKEKEGSNESCLLNLLVSQKTLTCVVYAVSIFAALGVVYYLTYSSLR